MFRNLSKVTFCSRTLKVNDKISSVNAINWSNNQTLITATEHEVVWRAVNQGSLRPDLLDILLFESIGSKFLHFRKKLHDSCISVIGLHVLHVWVENCKLLSGGNVQELNINVQFSESRVDSEHWRQQTSPPNASAFYIYLFFTSHQGQVCFVTQDAADNSTRLCLNLLVVGPHSSLKSYPWCQ